MNIYIYIYIYDAYRRRRRGKIQYSTAQHYILYALTNKCIMLLVLSFLFVLLIVIFIFILIFSEPPLSRVSNMPCRVLFHRVEARVVRPLFMIHEPLTSLMSRHKSSFVLQVNLDNPWLSFAVRIFSTYFSCFVFTHSNGVYGYY